MQKINILGVEVDTNTLPEMLDFIAQTIAAHNRALVTHINVTGLNLAFEQAWLRDFFNNSDRVFCDGMGVILGARILGWSLPERFTLADWIWILAQHLADREYSCYLLGNPPGVSERAARRLQASSPNLKILGAHHGYFNKQPGSSENNAVIEQINQARPNLLLVGFGMPVQERWLMENWPGLDVNVAITSGALFEYISGDLKRGPRWMTEHYLEWLARVLISPGRYGRRYLRDNPLFFYRILKQKFSQGTG